MHTPIAQIAGMRTGTTLDSIVGTFTEIDSDRKSGDNTHGQWSLQGAKFRDDDGNTIRVQFKNQDLVPTNWCGRRVEVKTVGDSKAKGVCVDEYQGKKRLVIHPTVEFSWFQSDSPPPRQQEPAQREERRQEQPPPRNDPPRQESRQSAPQGQQNSQGNGNGDAGLKEARTFLSQLGFGYVLCYDAAAAVAWRNYDQHGQITTSAAVGAMATTFFIELNKRGMTSSLPVGSFTKYPIKGRKLRELTDLLTEAGIQIAVEKERALRHLLEEEKSAPPAARRPADADRPESFQDGPAGGNRSASNFPPGLDDEDEIPF